LKNQSLSTRLYWIDIAKGVGILLVVLGHAGRGIAEAGVSDPGGFLSTMDRMIYSFHMPLFFILSGVLFGMRPPVAVDMNLAKRLWWLLFPLVVWTYVFLFFRALAGASANVNSGWDGILVWPIPPYGHFWFLWALLVLTAVFSVFSALTDLFVAKIRFFGLAALGALILSFVTLPEPLQPYLQASFFYGAAFAVGCVIGASPFVRSVPSWTYAAGGCVGFIGLLFALTVFDGSPLPRHIDGVLVSLFLIVLIMTVSARFSHLRVFQALAFCGKISLAIYVMHTIFSAALRIGLFAVGVDDLFVQLALVTGIGVLGPLVAYLLMQKWRLLPYFGFK
jgi:fucose 4-O-acetylase-like acetyltransferase